MTVCLMNEHEQFMHEAVLLAAESVEKRSGGPFGAVIVRDGRVVGQGANSVTSTNDPTAHAEIVAIRQACTKLGTFVLDDCACYTTCEPCPMCMAALYWARVQRLYYACTQEDAKQFGFDDVRIHTELCRPAPHRELHGQQVGRDEALRVFRLWDEDPDKTLY